MQKFTVVADTGNVVWQGESANGTQACERAADCAGINATGFIPYEAEPPSHKEDGVARIVVSVYRGSVSWPFREEDYLGTFMAVARGQ